MVQGHECVNKKKHQYQQYSQNINEMSIMWTIVKFQQR